MKLSVFGLMLMLFLAMSCDKEVITSTNGNETGILWSKKLSDETDFALTHTQFPFEDSAVIFGGTEDNHGYLIGFEIESGKEIWKYSNEALPAISGINMINTYQHGAKTYLFDSPQNHYFIDIEEGVTMNFETESKFPQGNIGVDDRLFKTVVKTDGDGFLCDCIVENNLENPGEFRDVICPNYNFIDTYVTGFFGYIREMDLFFADGDTLMLMGFLDATANPQELASFWGIYNLSKKQWEIEKIPIFETPYRQINMTFQYNNQLYFSGGVTRTECWDLSTNEVLWSKDIAGKHILIEELDLLIIGDNRTNVTYALNPNTGQEIWINNISSNSPYHYQDDVLYFIGAGDGLLHAMDIHTGADIWSFQTPDKDENDSSWTWQINGIPAQNGEKGKIFASSSFTGYCFEAVN